MSDPLTQAQKRMDSAFDAAISRIREAGVERDVLLLVNKGRDETMMNGSSPAQRLEDV